MALASVWECTSKKLSKQKFPLRYFVSLCSYQQQTIPRIKWTVPHTSFLLGKHCSCHSNKPVYMAKIQVWKHFKLKIDYEPCNFCLLTKTLFKAGFLGPLNSTINVTLQLIVDLSRQNDWVLVYYQREVFHFHEITFWINITKYLKNEYNL